MYTKLKVLQHQLSPQWCDDVNKHASTLRPNPGIGSAKHVANFRRCTVRTINKPTPMYNYIFNTMFNIIDQHMDYFNVEIFRKINNDAFQHITYNTGDHLKLHIDSYTKEYYEMYKNSNTEVNNKLSVVVMLSDPSEFTGGDFFYGPVNPHKPWENILRGKGTVAIFTSYAFHQVTPVLSGTRKTLFFWVEGPQWR